MKLSDEARSRWLAIRKRADSIEPYDDDDDDDVEDAESYECGLMCFDYAFLLNIIISKQPCSPPPVTRASYRPA